MGKIIGALFCFLLSFVAVIQAFYQTSVTDNPRDYYRLSVNLSKPSELYHPSKSPAYLTFKFYEYPGINFELSFKYWREKEVPAFNVGDSAVVVVLREEYHRTVNKSGNFFERLVTG